MSTFYITYSSYTSILLTGTSADNNNNMQLLMRHVSVSKMTNNRHDPHICFLLAA